VTPQQDVTRGEAARLKEVEPSKFRGSNPLSDPQSNKAIRSLQQLAGGFSLRQETSESKKSNEQE